jgi:hypothetical protein
MDNALICDSISHYGRGAIILCVGNRSFLFHSVANLYVNQSITPPFAPKFTLFNHAITLKNLCSYSASHTSPPPRLVHGTTADHLIRNPSILALTKWQRCSTFLSCCRFHDFSMRNCQERIRWARIRGFFFSFCQVTVENVENGLVL